MKLLANQTSICLTNKIYLVHRVVITQLVWLSEQLFLELSLCLLELLELQLTLKMDPLDFMNGHVWGLPLHFGMDQPHGLARELLVMLKK